MHLGELYNISENQTGRPYRCHVLEEQSLAFVDVRARLWRRPYVRSGRNLYACDLANETIVVTFLRPSTTDGKPVPVDNRKTNLAQIRLTYGKRVPADNRKTVLAQIRFTDGKPVPAVSQNCRQSAGIGPSPLATWVVLSSVHCRL